MPVHCTSLCYSSKIAHRLAPSSSLITGRRFVSPLHVPILSCSNGLRFSTIRSGGSGCAPVQAVVSEENAIGSSSSSTGGYKRTYLEGNSWLWEVGGVRFLVDPILVGSLDFGIPLLYDAAKRILKNCQLSDLPEFDCLLITQSLDDHCHLKTLKPLSEKSPDLRIIATPNTKPLLDPLFRNVTYLEPGESHEVEARNGPRKVTVRATAGPVLGTPWQLPENGFIVPMRNGDLESKGLLTQVLSFYLYHKNPRNH